MSQKGPYHFVYTLGLLFPFVAAVAAVRATHLVERCNRWWADRQAPRGPIGPDTELQDVEDNCW